MSQGSRVAIVSLVIGVGGGIFFWWRNQPPPAPPVAIPILAAPTPTPPPPPTPAAPAIQHPIEKPSAAVGLPGLDEADDYIKNALFELMGRKGVLAFLNIDGFVRRVVATVDNLARASVSVQVWPVKPTAGGFEADVQGDGTFVGAKNAQRYAGVISFVQAINVRRTVALYVRVYPLFQTAYEELGYPGKHFNDRVVEVIDHLLATPDVVGPVKVKRAVAEGADKTVRPGSLYQFEDPTLEARSAGQKILLRVGPQNAQVIKTLLGAIRSGIAKIPAAAVTKPATR